jgi:hypothetical protein
MRAAAFAIGAIQAMSDSEWRPGLSFMDRVDYISSVSGGSWAACSLASAAAEKVEKPFSSQDLQHISHIARRAQLLNSRGWKDYFEIAGLWLYSFSTGLLIILPYILICAAIFLLCFPDVVSLETFSDGQFGQYVRILFLYFILPFYLVFVITYSTKQLRWIAFFLGNYWPQALLIFAILLFVLIQPIVVLKNLPGYGIYEGLYASPIRFVLGFHEIAGLGGALAVSVFFLIVLLLREEQFGRKTTRSLGSILRRFGISVLLAITGILVPLFLWGIVLMLARWGVDGVTTLCPGDVESCGLTGHHFAPAWAVGFARFVDCTLSNYVGSLCAGKSWGSSCTIHDPCAKIFAFIYLTLALILFLFNKFILDTNWTSLHRFYRDRLNNSFIFRIQPVTERQSISSVRGIKSIPYLLVNCTANIPIKTTDVTNTESFIISPLHTGNSLIGFADTVLFEKIAGQYFDIATVAAISGAAISPVMGRYTSKSFRMLMSLLGFRLGYWIPNPRHVTEGASKSELKEISAGKRVGSGYYLREMLGRMSSTSDFIYLTDGGHTDNSGIFELLRRRCSTIVAIDAEADPDLLFDNISYVTQLARVRLNVDIVLSAKQVGEPNGVHCAIADIKYPVLDNASGFVGKLIYCKSSVIGTENWDLVSRKKATGEFPYNSTLNQNYDELLFEAYRALAYQIVSELLKAQTPAEFANKQVRDVTPADIDGFFADA